MRKLSWSELVRDLHSADIKRAVNACEKIEQLAGEEHVPELYSLLDDGSFFVRETAAKPLARLEGVRALPLLCRAYSRGLQDGHDNDSLTATLAGLLERNQAEAAPLLLEMLQSDDEETRLNAAWGLGFVASQVPPDPLLKLLDHETDIMVRAAAARSLGSFIGSPQAFDRLVGLLKDPSLHIKVAAIAALGDLGDPRAIAPLRNLLKDASDTIRLSVQYALENLE